MVLVPGNSKSTTYQKNYKIIFCFSFYKIFKNKYLIFTVFSYFFYFEKSYLPLLIIFFKVILSLFFHSVYPFAFLPNIAIAAIDGDENK